MPVPRPVIRLLIRAAQLTLSFLLSPFTTVAAALKTFSSWRTPSSRPKLIANQGCTTVAFPGLCNNCCRKPTLPPSPSIHLVSLHYHFSVTRWGTFDADMMAELLQHLFGLMWGHVSTKKTPVRQIINYP